MKRKRFINRSFFLSLMVYIRINVPQHIANEPRRNIADFLRNDYPKQITPLQVGVIDSVPADNRAARTQEEWIPNFNQQRKRMISAPDVYWIGQNGKPELVKSIRDDINKSWLITSTREIYNPNTFDARVTHNHGSTVVQPTGKTVLVPVYQQAPLDDVFTEEEGVAYLRVKLGTNDSPEKIRETLAALSGVPTNLIYVWTPDQKSRANYQKRAADFGLGDDGFYVSGDSCVYGYSGRSRGMSVKSAKPTRILKNIKK